MPHDFPLPSQIADVPGAEQWRSMYPYFTRFQPADDNRFWFYNAMHFPEPMPAFDAITAEIPYTAVSSNPARVFVLPTTLGIDHRILNGRVYITANPVLDPAEIGRRLGHFQERAGHYYGNWDALYQGWKERIRGLIDEIGAVTVPELPEFEDIAVVLNSTGVAQNHYVRENFHRCLDLYSKMWHHHTEFLFLGYGAYLVFFEFCKKAFPEIPDQAVARMVAGIDVIMYRPDDELKKLAALAVESGVDDLFTDGANPAAVLDALRARGEAGAGWLAALDAARDPWFNVSTGDGFYHHHRSWSDDLTVPFAALPRYVRQVRAGEPLTRPTEALREERERIVAEYRSLLSTEEDRGTFDQMLGLCRVVFPYVEDHKFYCEHWFTTLFFGKIREFGRLLARSGVLDDAEDVFHLHHTEVDQALSDVMLAWASGGTPVGGAYFPPIVAERKRMLAVLKDWTPPPALGPAPEALNDPAVQMLWGITAQTLETWSAASVGDEREIHGHAASPGVVEGIARVLRDVNEIGQIQDGEILVCAVTAPSWGPVFGKIKGAVSDIGGTMSHAAIVAREYGMPAVVGTGQATQRIKTGQRLRVDGDRGIVRILD
ncbi:MAG TPA: PEP-utilizing enzyme [Rugosimonospora sp.]|nr:PEP-utilizing enzyme [Rugosimonospora sp.]